MLKILAIALPVYFSIELEQILQTMENNLSQSIEKVQRTVWCGEVRIEHGNVSVAVGKRPVKSSTGPWKRQRSQPTQLWQYQMQTIGYSWTLFFQMRQNTYIIIRSEGSKHTFIRRQPLLNIKQNGRHRHSPRARAYKVRWANVQELFLKYSIFSEISYLYFFYFTVNNK